MCHSALVFVFFKRKTAYEMRISDWSSDVCSSDLCAERMGRTRTAVGVMASRLNLRTEVTNRARRPSLSGAELEEAIRLHEDDGWSFERLGQKFGYCETAVSNAVLIALCPRKGHRPAARNEYGRLMPEVVERMRLLLRKGLQGVEIQLRM